jgi:ribosomal protein L3 glutamine methyltransferase
LKAATVADALEQAAQRLDRARLFFGHGTHNAYDEAAWLLLHVLRVPPDNLDAVSGRKLSPAQHARFERLLEHRIEERIPVAYLLHEAWLGPHRFYVDERVIVPRSFIAELLAEKLQPWLRRPGRAMDVLDLCTGSACLAILAALNLRRARVDASDLSGEALKVAHRNVRDYELSERVRLLKSDLFRDLPPKAYDLILSNPPYVDAASMRTLPKEYRREPEMALASGRDGLDAVRAILRDAKRFLSEEGLLVVEIGHNRQALERAFPHLPFVWLDVSAGDEYVFLLERKQLL